MEVLGILPHMSMLALLGVRVWIREQKNDQKPAQTPANSLALCATLSPFRLAEQIGSFFSSASVWWCIYRDLPH